MERVVYFHVKIRNSSSQPRKRKFFLICCFHGKKSKNKPETSYPQPQPWHLYLDNNYFSLLNIDPNQLQLPILCHNLSFHHLWYSPREIQLTKPIVHNIWICHCYKSKKLEKTTENLSSKLIRFRNFFIFIPDYN